jgi:hypothetical protein
MVDVSGSEPPKTEGREILLYDYHRHPRLWTEDHSSSPVPGAPPQPPSGRRRQSQRRAGFGRFGDLHSLQLHRVPDGPEADLLNG